MTKPRWSAEDSAMFDRLYPETPNLELARIFGRSLLSIENRAYVRCLSKSAARLHAAAAEKGRKSALIVNQRPAAPKSAKRTRRQPAPRQPRGGIGRVSSIFDLAGVLGATA